MEIKNISYNNIYLSEKDIKCFKNSNQLNDMCISFYFEYLTNEIFKESKDDFVLLDPVVVSSIYFDESIEDLSDMLMKRA